MFNVNELFEEIARLKAEKGFIANNFLSPHDMARISKEADSRLMYDNQAALIVNNDNGVIRAHFYLASLESVFVLPALLNDAPKRPLVVDCIGYGLEVEAISEALCMAGFKPYAKLSRWKSSSICFFSYPHFIDSAFRNATGQDDNCILKILGDTFDPNIAHLPTKAYLHSLIDKDMVFCAEYDGEIVAVVCLDKLGRKTVYLYQDAVIEPFRSTGIGILLLQFALYRFKEYPRFVTWTEDKNTASNRMHEALGMAYDGLKDHVLIYE